MRRRRYFNYYFNIMFFNNYKLLLLINFSRCLKISFLQKFSTESKSKLIRLATEPRITMELRSNRLFCIAEGRACTFLYIARFQLTCFNRVEIFCKYINRIFTLISSLATLVMDHNLWFNKERAKLGE